jgi:hypothetical protein
MNRLLISLITFAAPSLAQFAAPARPPASLSIEQPRLSFDVVRKLEGQFDGLISSPGRKEPFDIYGPTRALYMPGYGMIITAELDLIVVPGAPALFRRTPTPQEITQIHTRKLENVLVLEQLMRDMMTSSAQRLDIMPDSERVVLAVRLIYRQWEDTSKLPTQILMTADRKSAIAGQIKEESSK